MSDLPLLSPHPIPSGPLPFLPPFHPSPALTLLPCFQGALWCSGPRCRDPGRLRGGDRSVSGLQSFLALLVTKSPRFLMSSRAKRPDRTHHDWVSLAVPVGAAYLLVLGLQPHIQYQFSVLAQNKLGSGPFSEIVLSAPEGERSPTAPMPASDRTG